MAIDRQATDRQIESYCRQMAACLWWVDAEVRAEIIDETEAHLIFRQAAGTFDATMAEFGPPCVYARNYARAVYSTPLERLRMKLGALIRRGISRISIPFKILSSIALLLALAKLARPSLIGIWIEEDNVSLIKGCDVCSSASDPVGMLFIPLMLGASLLLFLGAGYVQARYR